jgi:hypothetical protein
MEGQSSQRPKKTTLFGMMKRESPSRIVPDSTLPITTVPMSLNLSIIGILQRSEVQSLQEKES